MIETRNSAQASASAQHLLGPAYRAESFVAQLAQLGEMLPGLDETAGRAALRALDTLLACAQRRVPHALAEATLDSARRAAALRHIRLHLEVPQLSPASVAAGLGISVRQLHRAFHRSGHTVSGEIRRLRIEHARSLVEARHRAPITDIALECGFASLASFYRAFKAEFGMTASQVRERAARSPRTLEDRQASR